MKTAIAICLAIGLGSMGCGGKPAADDQVDNKDATATASANADRTGADKQPSVGETAKPHKGIGDAAPPPKADPVKVLDFAGIQTLISGHKGRLVVVDAWATYCPPCMRDFHHLVELHNKYGGDKVACVSLSFDYGDDDIEMKDLKPKLQAFLDSQGATFDNIVSSDNYETLYEKFDFDAVPAVFVYGADGDLLARVDHSGDDESPIYDRVKAIIEQHLRKDAS